MDFKVGLEGFMKTIYNRIYIYSGEGIGSGTVKKESKVTEFWLQLGHKMVDLN